jgi:DNA polymerase III delta subunit
MSDRDLAGHAKVPPWKIRQLNQQLRRWTQRDLAEAILVLGDLDAAMKGGLREGEQLEPAQKGLAIETAVVSLSHR